MSLRPVSLFVLVALLLSTFATVAPTAQTTAAPATLATLPAPVQAVTPVETDLAPEVQASVTKAITPTASIALRPIGTYKGQGAEIVAFDTDSQRLFVVNAAGSVEILDASDPTNLTFISAITTTTELPPYGGTPNSVAVKNGLVAIAVENGAVRTDPGAVLFYDTNGTLLNAVQAGALPDMVTFTPDGNKALVANEGEPNPDFTIDPEGSVTIIDIPATPITPATVLNTVEVSFTDFNKGGPRHAEAVAANIRTPNPGTSTVAQDLEPEYIALSADSSKAYVAMQENNTLAIIDIATATVDTLIGLGTKDHSLPGNELDASDRDDTINIRNWPVRGIYQPDAIATFTVGGETYIATANEGDARDYDGFTEEVRVRDIMLDSTVFPDSTIRDNENLGRLRLTNTPAFLGTAKVRVVHASPDAPNVDVYLTPFADAVYTQTRVLADVPFFTVSNYLSVNPGTYNYAVTPAGDANTLVLSGTVTLDGGAAYTLAATDVLTNITARVFVDNIAGTKPDNAKVRVYHLSPDAPAVDVVANNDVTLVSDLAFPNASNDFQVEEGIYDLQVRVAGTDTVAIDLLGTELNANIAYSVFAIGQLVSITAALEPLRFSELYSFGARSFTIWNSSGERVYDSGNDFEQIAAAMFPQAFNTNFDVEAGRYGGFDERSDDKGPEPEAVTTGVIAGRTYAFVGLERQGGIMVYDVTTPTAPTFVQYVNNTDFEGTIEDGTVGDVSPEGIIFISAEDSPNGQPLVVVANEVSGTTTVYEIGDPNGAATLSLMHNNDGESALLEGSQPVGEVSLPVAGVSAFKSVFDREVRDARSSGKAVLGVYAGDSYLASAAIQCSFPLTGTTEPVYDAIAQRQMPYSAHIIGNHEFDFGPNFLARFIRNFAINGVLQQPFLSANLDFSETPAFNGLIREGGVVVGVSTKGDVVARSMIHTDQLTGARFGVVAATTELLPTISSPDTVLVTTANVTETADLVQSEINRLQTDFGVNKIIFVGHLQGVRFDEQLIALVSDIDIAVAGGGDELLGTPDVVIPGDADKIVGPYPRLVPDKDGNEVPLVTSEGNYRYLGRLDVEFDAMGNVARVITETSFPRRVIPESPEAATLGLTDVVSRNMALESSVVTPISTCLEGLATDIVATTQITIDVSRISVRTREANGGNLVTDSYLFKYEQAQGNLPNNVIAVANGGGIRQNAGDELEVGGISRLDTLNVLPFDNRLVVVEDMTPAELKAAFERSGSALPSQSGGFLQVSGITVTYDLEQPAGSRVQSLRLRSTGQALVENGAPVAGAPNVDVVTVNFTAEGGDGYVEFAAKPNTPLLDNGVQILYEQAFREYLQDLQVVQADDPRYQLEGEGRIVQATPVAPEFVETPIDLSQLTTLTISGEQFPAIAGITVTLLFAPGTTTVPTLTNARLRMTPVVSTSIVSESAVLAGGLDRFLQIEVLDENGQVISPIRFTPAITATIDYADSVLVPTGAVTPVNELLLQFPSYDPATQQWTTDGSRRDNSSSPAANTLVVKIDHLTLFGLAAPTPRLYLPIVIGPAATQVQTPTVTPTIMPTMMPTVTETVTPTATPEMTSTMLTGVSSLLPVPTATSQPLALVAARIEE
ncbi:MAG: DUF4397 domain-containing protein [Chloroflexaceae bacterium]|nr:DUF4397 domain-containing protein [Chloroflexaceae bacterium]